MDVIPFETDLSTLVIFDLEQLSGRVREPSSWWREGELTALPEVLEGKVGIVPIGTEGAYRVQVCVGELDPDVAARVSGCVEGLGLEVSSGSVFVGAAERLPGDGRDGWAHVPGTGSLVELEEGSYAVVVHVVAWREDDAFYDDDNEVLPSAPADFVVQLRPRAEEVDPPHALPNLLELLPKKEVQGQAKVPGYVRKRRGTPEPSGKRRGGGRSVAVAQHVPPPVSTPDGLRVLRVGEVEAAFREVLYREGARAPEGPAVKDVVWRPAKEGSMGQDAEFSELCRKVTRVREQMRMLEAKVNGSGSLGVFGKVELQQAVTGVYQALDGLLERVGAELVVERAT